MKDLGLLVWLTQLGISVIVPVGVFVMLSLWLQDLFSLGNWILIAGITIGCMIAIYEFFQTLKMLDRVANKKKKEKSASVFFNEHE